MMSRLEDYEVYVSILTIFSSIFFMFTFFIDLLVTLAILKYSPNIVILYEANRQFIGAGMLPRPAIEGSDAQNVV